MHIIRLYGGGDWDNFGENRMHCKGCGRTDNVMDLEGEDWCPWCVLDGPNCLKQVAEDMAPLRKSKEEIYAAWVLRNPNITPKEISRPLTQREALAHANH